MKPLADIAILLATWIFIGAIYARASFYRAYFFEKQRNMGNDPRAVLRREFPWIWRIM